MNRMSHGLLLLSILVATRIGAQTPPTVEPFKLGTFVSGVSGASGGRTFIGIVLKDTTVVDVAAANAALEARNASWPKMTMPQDMTELIARYGTSSSGGLKERIYAIAREGGSPAPYVRDLKAVTVRPPVMPRIILNAAVNYTEHASEMAARGGAAPAAPAAPPKSIEGLWERKSGDTRHNPYLFFKSPSAVIAHGEAIRVPPGRSQVDWECEMTVIIGRTASHVPIDKAVEYVFGYTLENDVSDRAARGDGRHGSDWLIGKSHDTFAPLGPFIVPREFIPDPQKLSIRFSLNGQLMQDSTTARMTHGVVDLIHFASNIVTLQPGDAIATGSTAGVGSARTPPIFMKAGDRAVCTVEGIGTLENPVVGPVAPSQP